MQFLPEIFSGNSVSALGGVSPTSAGKGFAGIGNADGFLDSFNQELAAAGVTPVVDTSLSTSLPRGFRTIKSDMTSKLDGEDVTAITDKLRKRGVSDTAFKSLEDALASGQIPTLGAIMNSVGKNGRTSDALSDDERAMLISALQKLQFPQEDIESIESFMDEGKGHAALSMISKGLSQLGGEGFSLEKGEVSALLRGLDLSDDTLGKLTALLGEMDEGGISGKALETLLTPARQELARRKTDEETMANEMKAVIEEALREKKIRESTELVADTRGSRKADRAETRMRDDMTARANGLGEGHEDRLRRLEEEDARKEQASAEENGARQQRERAGKSEESGRRTVSAFESTASSAAGAGTEKASSRAKGEFNALVDRIDAATGMTAPVQAQNTARDAEASLVQRREIFSQVEQGMLRQLQDGSSQMTLRLDPAELGQVSLLLTVKGGEVRALIRADNPEATAAISEQMSQLRASLEEQGLKVADISVETRLPQDTTNGEWSGTAGFNQEQEMREQARFLRLAKLRREAGTDLAQDVQSRGTLEEISASGLHIIA